MPSTTHSPQLVEFDQFRDDGEKLLNHANLLFEVGISAHSLVVWWSGANSVSLCLFVFFQLHNGQRYSWGVAQHALVAEM